MIIKISITFLAGEKRDSEGNGQKKGILIPGYIINHGRKLYEEAEKVSGIVAKS